MRIIRALPESTGSYATHNSHIPASLFLCYYLSIMQLTDIKKLANLARIDMNDEELQEIAKSFDSILEYVGQVQEVSKIKNIELESKNSENYFLHNVMRDDVVTNNREEYKDKIMAEMPDTQDGFLKVKQIL